MDIMAALFVGCGIITLFLLFMTFFLEHIRRENSKNRLQNIDNELQYHIDNMTPRELFIHKATQNKLIWDPRTQAYIRKWSKNDTTYH